MQSQFSEYFVAVEDWFTSFCSSLLDVENQGILPHLATSSEYYDIFYSKIPQKIIARVSTWILLSIEEHPDPAFRDDARESFIKDVLQFDPFVGHSTTPRRLLRVSLYACLAPLQKENAIDAYFDFCKRVDGRAAHWISEHMVFGLHKMRPVPSIEMQGVKISSINSVTLAMAMDLIVNGQPKVE